MPFFVLVMFVKVIYEAIRVFRKKNRAAKPEPLCVGCLHAHVVYSTPEHEELKWIAKSCITRHHAHHYFGFAENQWRLFQKEDPPKVKPLLYVFRVLLTGIHLMRTGVVEANLNTLNEEYRLTYILELIERKTRGAEHQSLDSVETSFYATEFDRLRTKLENEANKTSLPESQTARAALNDLLVRVRLKTVGVLREPGTQCPVCLLPYAFQEPGGHENCSQCGWEDDPAQRSCPEMSGGANKYSLVEARESWRGAKISQ